MHLAGYLCVLALCAKGLASDFPSANVFWAPAIYLSTIGGVWDRTELTKSFTAHLSDTWWAVNKSRVAGAVKKDMETCFSILAWRIPWTEKPTEATVHRIAKSGTWLKRLSMHMHTSIKSYLTPKEGMVFNTRISTGQGEPWTRRNFPGDRNRGAKDQWSNVFPVGPERVVCQQNKRPHMHLFL